MKYTTAYTPSNGQPSTCHEMHESLDAALTAWYHNIGGLLHRSGGVSALQAWETADFVSDNAEPAASILWLEHCEGGYVSAAGDWLEEVAHLARYEEENGETLTAAKLVCHLSNA